MVKNMMPKRAFVCFFFILLLAGLSAFISSTIPSLYSAIVDNGIMASNLGYIYKVLIWILALTVLNSIIKIYNSITINKQLWSRFSASKSPLTRRGSTQNTKIKGKRQTLTVYHHKTQLATIGYYLITTNPIIT